MIERLVVTHQQQRKLQKARDDHQRITDVARQTEEHFQLHAKRQRRQPDARVKFEPNLHHALGPTSLLRLESVDLDRNLRRRFFVEQVNELPAHQLRAETQIGVFSQRVVLPAAAHLDRLATPDAGSAVEVEKAAGAIARGLFDDEMTVEHDRLQARQQVVIAVDVRPAHLRATDHRIGEEVDQLAQAIGLGNEVGVEDREQLALGKLVAVLERAGFETGAIGAMDVVNVETLRRILRDDRFGDA